jgi:hypothetical protein
MTSDLYENCVCLLRPQQARWRACHWRRSSSSPELASIDLHVHTRAHHAKMRAGLLHTLFAAAIRPPTPHLFLATSVQAGAHHATTCISPDHMAPSLRRAPRPRRWIMSCTRASDNACIPHCDGTRRAPHTHTVMHRSQIDASYVKLWPGRSGSRWWT